MRSMYHRHLTLFIFLRIKFDYSLPNKIGYTFSIMRKLNNVRRLWCICKCMIFGISLK